MRRPRLALLGFGAMGRALGRSLTGGDGSIEVGALLVRSPPPDVPPGAAVFTSVTDLIAWKPDLVAECAGHGAVAETVPVLLGAGIAVVVTSLGALSDPALRDRVSHACRAGGGRVHLVSGAVGGLDALAAAKLAGLDEVIYTGRKPPSAWAGTVAATEHDLAALWKSTVIFEGPASLASRLYPKNANVTAAIALAGIGFERTRVRLVADPASSQNRHELRASGAFGDMEMRLANVSLPDNPKTSWLAALSVERIVRRELLPDLA